MARRLFKELERSYGFDEVAIVPGEVTINPEMTSTKMNLGRHSFDAPFIASAMDGAVSPRFAVLMHEMGGLGVLNAEGLYCRYEDPYSVLEEITSMSKAEATQYLQQVYSEPIKEHLIGARVQEIKQSGAVCAVSFTPQNTKRLSPMAVEAGADIVFVQSTVTTARHMSRSYKGLIFSDLINSLKVPVVVGNCVTYNVAIELMETGIEGILVGVGPGAACTTREVTGVGVPQVTATLECAAAREDYFHRTGRYVAVITDGGIRTGGDVCKSIASGADAVMIGTPFAQAEEAPGRGYNWGMANPNPELPRGTRIKVGTKGSLKQIMYGPTSETNGTQNLVGALRVSMGMCGAYTIRDFHKAEMVVAPSIKTEGKFFQMSD
ncbi:MAG: GuaB3 family IMP dehydrogenase-related protein [Chloroflexi bacterium]|nr:GuaB3 family IMP dehydrogenase-related protein [Chloroflexota bacterium]MDA1219583.1 GuaB3 family IMP dehydrogenase-related protein [Chloroflexota bacterium]PKB57550.1 MAG: inosine 5-monophosphate dehydrogenase [SAR202 cluster bacterium Casp-Chloro-G3]